MILLALIGCAWRLGPPEVVYGEMEPLPLVRTSIDDRWYVPMEIEGEGWVWFFDTGYSHTTCDDGLAEALERETRGRRRVRGELGSLATTKMQVPPFTFGGHRIEGLVCQVRDLNKTSSIRDPREVRVAGVIGMDILRAFTMEADPQKGEIRLHSPDHGPTVGDGPGTLALRRELSFGLRVKVPLGIEDDELWPILDTGASTSYLDIGKLGREPDAVRRGVVVRGTGLGGSDIRTMEYFDLEQVELAGILGGPVRVAGRHRGVGLLGLDVLSSYHATYDFRGGRARFVRTRPQPLTKWSAWRAAWTRTPASTLALDQE